MIKPEVQNDSGSWSNSQNKLSESLDWSPRSLYSQANDPYCSCCSAHLSGPPAQSPELDSIQAAVIFVKGEHSKIHVFIRKQDSWALEVCWNVRVLEQFVHPDYGPFCPHLLLSGLSLFSQNHLDLGAGKGHMQPEQCHHQYDSHILPTVPTLFPHPS